MQYDLLHPWNTLDDWQKRVITSKGNTVIKCGRQTGKSTSVSITAGETALNNSNKTVLIVAKTERQALLLFEKTHEYLYQTAKDQIKHGKDKPTKHELRLKNGSKIMAHPTGDTGYGIRGYAIDLLIADEAAFISEEVWTSIKPMIATRVKAGARIIVLGTPHGRTGYFYDCWQDTENFERFSINSEKCERVDQKWLAGEKKRMTQLQYAQEYLADFIDDFTQVYPTTLIDKCMTYKKGDPLPPDGKYYMGCDYARYGRGETTFEIVYKYQEGEKTKMIHTDNIVLKQTSGTEIIDKTLALVKQYNFPKFYIDDAGLGGPIFDFFKKHPLTKNKVVGIYNAKKSTSREDDPLMAHTRKTVKDDIYENLKLLMEQGNFTLLISDRVRESMQSIQYEFTKDGRVKIVGTDSHITEGLVRAAWGIKDNSLNLGRFSKGI